MKTSALATLLGVSATLVGVIAFATPTAALTTCKSGSWYPVCTNCDNYQTMCDDSPGSLNYLYPYLELGWDYGYETKLYGCFNGNCTYGADVPTSGGYYTNVGVYCSDARWHRDSQWRWDRQDTNSLVYCPSGTNVDDGDAWLMVY
jgi:hypothetical protein